MTDEEAWDSPAKDSATGVKGGNSMFSTATTSPAMMFAISPRAPGSAYKMAAKSRGGASKGAGMPSNMALPIYPTPASRVVRLKQREMGGL